MRATEFLKDDEEPIRIKIGGGGDTPAKKFVKAMYEKYPRSPINNREFYIAFSDEEFAMFDLQARAGDPNTAYVSWMSAYPQRQGVGSRALKQLQDDAAEHGVDLELIAWDKGNVSKAALTRFYKKMGFKKGMGDMLKWQHPVTENATNMSFTQVVAQFNNPQVTADLKEVLGWFPGSTVTFTVEKNVPIEKFEQQIKEMISTFDEFPQDAARSKKIRKLITQGSPQMPIFVDATDNFILEGRHRITAFYELGLLTVTVVYAYESKQIEEIAHADLLGDLSIPEETIISKASIAGKIDGKAVWQYKNGNNILYFFSNNNKFQALVLLDGNKFKAMKNFVKQPGYITALIGFIVHNKKMKIEISADEQLTSDGIRWLRSFILRGTKRFTITDQTGATVDVSKLEKEWNNSKTTGIAGNTAIYISENKNTTATIIHNSSRLMSTTLWIGNEGLL